MADIICLRCRKPGFKGNHNEFCEHYKPVSTTPMIAQPNMTWPISLAELIQSALKDDADKKPPGV